MKKNTKPKIPIKGFKSLRKGRFSQKEAFYFITSCCYNKQKIFLSKENVQIVFNAIDWFENKKYIECYFIILMPDHLHLVFQLTGDKTLSEVMKSLKQFTGKEIKKGTKTIDVVWQEQYYDHFIREEKSFFDAIEYCWYNPVRAGIVSNPKEYPHWKSKYIME